MGAFLSLINPISTLLDRILPDKAQNDAAKAQLIQLQVSGELQTVLAQIEVDKAEATSGHDGWRRMTGYICASALGYQFLFRPIATWVGGMFHYTMAAPELDMSSLLMVLGGMLGIGIHQSMETGNLPFASFTKQTGK